MINLTLRGFRHTLSSWAARAWPHYDGDPEVLCLAREFGVPTEQVHRFGIPVDRLMAPRAQLTAPERPDPRSRGAGRAGNPAPRLKEAARPARLAPVNRLRGTLPEEHRPTPAPAAALSPREREVATLIALGRSNPEIAAELVLSVRTVERHVANIYAKLGVSGAAARVAVATFALRDAFGPNPGQWLR